jgi:hypothetical protein
MKQVKIDIFSALKASIALNSIVAADSKGLKQIFSGWPPTTAIYPCVGFYRVSGTRGIADGRLSNFDELYSIDVFATTMTATEDALEAIDEVMDTLSYIVTREGDLDLYETDTKVFHKVLRYRIK